MASWTWLAVLFAMVAACGSDEDAGTSASGQGGGSSVSSTSAAGGAGGSGGTATNDCAAGQAQLVVEMQIAGPAAGTPRPRIFEPMLGVSVTASLCIDPFGADMASEPGEYDATADGGTLVFEGPNVDAVPVDMVQDFATLAGLRFEIFSYDSGAANVVVTTNSGEGQNTWGMRLECITSVTGRVDPNDVQPAALSCNMGGRVDLVYGNNVEWVVGPQTFVFTP